MNWRKPLISLALNLTGRPVFRCLKYLKSVEYESPEKLGQLQDEKLEKLLFHAYQNVPYYNRILPEAGVIKNNRVILENFGNIPVLTKSIIRREGENLYSKDHRERHSYKNYSGGSTGQPVEFLQDRNNQTWGLAYRFLYNSWYGKDIGQREIKFWGSERDVLDKAEKLSTRLRRWGFNVVVMNTFAMSEDKMSRHLARWNELKPRLVWSYMSSIHEFAKYIERTGADFFKPCAIISTAETLTEEVRGYVENVFKCPLFNQYGSREIGLGGCECSRKQGMHTFTLHNKMEILDVNLKPCPPGETGQIFVTTLDNYSMPLIRYDIGDLAVPAYNSICSCKRAFPLIDAVVGRHVEAFRTREGKMIPGEFFIHFVGVVYNKGFIKRFQVIQKDYDKILIRVAVLDLEKFNEFKPELVNAIKKVMSDQCDVEFEYVDDILPTPSGKYLYTVSEVTEQLKVREHTE